MKAIILSNCTHAPLKEYFSATGLFDRVESTPLYAIPPAERDGLYARLREFDVVVSLVHGASWGNLCAESLKSEFGDRCVLFTTPFFNGLHPDLVHIQVEGKNKVRSPLSDYHSGLVLWGFLRGVGTRALEEMYLAGELPDLFDAAGNWERAMQALRLRDRDSDILTADIYDTVCRAEPGMLTFNHPGMSILSEISRRLLDRLGLGARSPRLSPVSVYNPLIRDVAFPVSPAAVRHNGLSYPASPVFRCGLSGVRPGEMFSFREFAELCYRQYGEMKIIDGLIVTTPSYLEGSFQEVISGFVQSRGDGPGRT